MATFKDFFSPARAQRGDTREADASQSRGPETAPVKMNLEERMAFRRELLFETIKGSLNSREIDASSYRFKIMRTDKRGHCYVVMLDMSPAFMDSARGQSKQLADLAALLTRNAQSRYGLVVGGVYWRADDTLDATVARWARPSTPSGHAATPHNPTDGEFEKSERASAKELADFEAAWHKSSDIKVGDRTYSSDLAPLTDDWPPKK